MPADIACDRTILTAQLLVLTPSICTSVLSLSYTLSQWWISFSSTADPIDQLARDLDKYRASPKSSNPQAARAHNPILHYCNPLRTLAEYFRYKQARQISCAPKRLHTSHGPINRLLLLASSKAIKFSLCGPEQPPLNSRMETSTIHLLFEAPFRNTRRFSTLFSPAAAAIT
jgi:hypothetical protein